MLDRMLGFMQPTTFLAQVAQERGEDAAGAGKALSRVLHGGVIEEEGVPLQGQRVRTHTSMGSEA